MASIPERVFTRILTLTLASDHSVFLQFVVFCSIFLPTDDRTEHLTTFCQPFTASIFAMEIA